ncbi:CNGA3 [Symbiodinium sp. CCMP2456]|nr:CNGA3 [Symbiodinium sp. CCMP2456]
MSRTLLAQRLQDLEDELQDAFHRVQDRVNVLRQDLVEDMPAEVGTVEEDATQVSDSPNLLEDWLLKEDVLSIPNEEPTTLSGDALHLSAEMLSGHARSYLRLNSHLMELSMRAAESVTVFRKERMSTLSVSPVATVSPRTRQIRNVAAQLSTELEKCESIFKVFPPNSTFRLIWDFCGISFIVLDAFLLPMCIAWGWEISPMPPSSPTFDNQLFQLFAIVSLVFWPLDILVNFNTAFYTQGRVETRRSQIAKRYAATWLPFDICVVTIDYLAGLLVQATEEQTTDFLQPLRSARYLRIMRTVRILRIVKAGKINVLLENLVISLGRQWLILAFTVGKMLLVIGAVAHILACIWYALGDTISQERDSWLQLAQVGDAPFQTQYIHSLSWILLTPSPAPLEPDSNIEHTAVLVLFVTTVLVIGSALSILTGTLNEIRQVNSERSKKRRELRIFLQNRLVPTELLMRIMSYADYKMTRHSPIAYDTTLISPMLEAELATSQFGSVLTSHPLLGFISSMYPSVFAECCRSLHKLFFCEGEAVFDEGSMAEKMYITSHGKFKLTADSLQSDDVTFDDDGQYFAEISLYVEAVMHGYSLNTDSFSEVFCLSPADFAKVLVHSPICCTMVIEYANEFITRYSTGPSATQISVWHQVEREQECARGACECNSFYLEEHVDHRLDLETLDLSYLQNPVISSMTVGIKPNDPKASPGENDSQQSALPSPAVQLQGGVHDGVGLTCMDFVASVVRSQETIEDTLASLREAFVELDPEYGLHARFSDTKEQERAESAILSLIAIVRGDYRMYTAAQPQQSRLTESQWQHIQELFAWTAPNDEKLLAVIFLLAVKGATKYRSLTRQLPTGLHRQEKAMNFILDTFPSAVPSAASLGSKVKKLVRNLLRMQGTFSFAQMLQGENVPANIRDLKEAIQPHGGEELLKFYVLYLLGFMSGIAGGKGSRFMTQGNARTTLLGLSTLQHILEQDPAPLYWTYIHYRGLELGRHAKTPADLALLRLACNCRVQTSKDLEALQEAWDFLTGPEQQQLTKNLLADGIATRAVVCEFLPLCLERACSNPFVKVSALLQVLVELLKAVHAAAEQGDLIVTVDLADLAAFILMVRNSYVFETCLARATLTMREERFYVDVSQNNWRRVSEPATDVILLASSVRELVHKSRKSDDANLTAEQKVLVQCHL